MAMARSALTYYRRVLRHVRSRLASHVREHIAVSLAIAVATGVVAWQVLDAGPVSLIASVAAFGIWMTLTASCYAVLAPVELDSKLRSDREATLDRLSDVSRQLDGAQSVRETNADALRTCRHNLNWLHKRWDGENMARWQSGRGQWGEWWEQWEAAWRHATEVREQFDLPMVPPFNDPTIYDFDRIERRRIPVMLAAAIDVIDQEIELV